jgi:hypothetical protein
MPLVDVERRSFIAPDPIFRSFEFNALGSLTHESSEGPKQQPNYENGILLGSSEISGKDIDDSDQAANGPYEEPPKDPVMNA